MPGTPSDDARTAAEAAERRLATAQSNFDTSADDSPRREETKRALDKQTKEVAKARKLLRTAEAAKRKANERVVDANRALFVASQPRPTKREDDARAKALAIAIDANAKYESAAANAQDVAGRFEAARNEYAAAEAGRISAAAAVQEAIGRTEPVSIFVSLKTKRLYLRQAHAPVFDMPITIADPGKPIGTHVFTAADYTSRGDDLRWTVVSVGRNHSSGTGAKRAANISAEAPPTDVKLASAALDRLTMPPEVLARISGYVWPGSSLIISDEEMSSETGTATDFVVVMSNEPQGGLKSRAAEVAASKRKSVDKKDDRRGDDDDDDDDGRDRKHSNRYRPEHSSFFSFW
ncbi:MAG: hypothetical protein WDN31_04210 [Hyphomicrobium sp.]